MRATQPFRAATGLVLGSGAGVLPTGETVPNEPASGAAPASDAERRGARR
jgi:hypothetical protein